MSGGRHKGRAVSAGLRWRGLMALSKPPVSAEQHYVYGIIFQKCFVHIICRNRLSANSGHQLSFQKPNKTVPMRSMLASPPSPFVVASMINDGGLS